MRTHSAAREAAPAHSCPPAEPGWLHRQMQELETKLREAVAARLDAETRLAQVMKGLEPAAQAASPVRAEVLAREADHRTKNSLQTVISLMRKQASKSESDDVRDALGLASARVAAIAEVHAVLHATTAPRGVVPHLDLKTYMERLCCALGRTMDVDGEHRSLRVSMTPLPVSPTDAQCIGLTVSELVTNAFRHAFWADRPGTVRVSSAQGGDGTYQIRVEDDGRGLPRGFDMRHRPSPGLGLRLVNMLVDQARAHLSVDDHAGTRFTLSLARPLPANPAQMASTGGEMN